MGRPKHSQTDPERLTIRLDPALAERLRVLAARQRRSMSAIAEEALACFLPQAERSQRAKGRKAEPGEPSKRVPEPTAWEVWTAEDIRRELVLLDATQAELASLLGVRPSSLSLWLGKRGIPFLRQRSLTAAIQKLRRSRRSRK